MGLFDGVDDAVQRGLAGSGRDAQLQLRLRVERAGVQLVAGRFVYRQTLATQAGLVHGAVAGGNDSVQRHAATGANAQRAAQRHLRHRHAVPLAVRRLHVGLVGAEGQQRANRVARTAHGSLFDALGQRIQRHHHCSFWPLADGKGAGDCNRHQRIHAQLPAQQCAHARAVNA